MEEKSVYYDIYDQKQSYEIMSRILEQNEKQFDSVILGTNFCIYGVLRAFKEKKRAFVPVAGFEDFDGSEVIEGDFIKAVQPEEKIGEEAFYILLQCLNDKKPQDVLLKTDGILEKSTAF